MRTQGTRGVFSSRGVAGASATADSPGGEPPPRASVSLAAPPPPRCLQGCPGRAGGGKGGPPAGGRIRPCRGRPGHRKHPPPLFKPLPVVRRAPGVRTCVWAGAGTSLKAPRGPSRPWEGAVAGRGARAAPERVCAGGPSSGSVGPRLGAGRGKDGPAAASLRRDVAVRGAGNASGGNCPGRGAVPPPPPACRG